MRKNKKEKIIEKMISGERRIKKIEFGAMKRVRTSFISVTYQRNCGVNLFL